MENVVRKNKRKALTGQTVQSSLTQITLMVEEINL
jgi:hypothetical protein